MMSGEVLTEMTWQHVAAPIQALPNEILELIFIEAWKPFRCLPSLDTVTFEWIAGQVCARWRQVALLLAQMWSELNVNILEGYDGGTGVGTVRRGGKISRLLPSSGEILQERLLRSGNSPLTVRIHCTSDHRANNSTPVASRLFSIIAAHSQRWKDVDIYITDQITAHFLFNQVNGRVPRLEKLQWRSGSLPNIVLAPSLCDLHIVGMSPTQWFPRWSQLQRVTLSALSSDRILDELHVLQTSQKLKEIRLTENNMFDLPGKDFRCQPGLKFEHLRVLYCWSSILDIFLELPALEMLELSSVTYMSRLPASIQRTCPALTSLILPTVKNDFDFTHILVDTLNLTPGLTTLDMSNIRHQNTVLGLLKYLSIHPEHPDRASLKNLQHVRIALRDPMEISAFLQMIQSRFSTLYDFPRLKTVTWTNKQSNLDGVKEHIKEMEKRGLQITFLGE
ncbi:hypothetical protein C8J56DRAFT_963504 [Mycena floridula]|nr:hypothetical protein C8J56DRAFT_963504 [Mycena floridula]